MALASFLNRNEISASGVEYIQERLREKLDEGAMVCCFSRKPFRLFAFKVVLAIIAWMWMFWAGLAFTVVAVLGALYYLVVYVLCIPGLGFCQSVLSSEKLYGCGVKVGSGGVVLYDDCISCYRVVFTGLDAECIGDDFRMHLFLDTPIFGEGCLYVDGETVELNKPCMLVSDGSKGDYLLTAAVR